MPEKSPQTRILSLMIVIQYPNKPVLVCLILFWILFLSIIPNLVKEKIRASDQYFLAFISIIEPAKVRDSALVLKPGLGAEREMWKEKHQA